MRRTGEEPKGNGGHLEAYSQLIVGEANEDVSDRGLGGALVIATDKLCEAMTRHWVVEQVFVGPN